MKKGFTLAEILITLSIVGIVAVLSVPSVMKNYSKRMYVAKLEKTYSQIANATAAVMDADKVDDFYETKAGRDPESFLTNYFKSSKQDCLKSSADSEACALSNSSTYKKLNGGSVSGPGSNSYCIQTVNGATICSFYNSHLPQPCTSIVVDVNGLDAPNTAGRDVFSMDIHKDGSISDYNSGCADNNFGCNASRCSVGGEGASAVTIANFACGCLTAVMEAGWKMEY